MSTNVKIGPPTGKHLDYADDFECSYCPNGSQCLKGFCYVSAALKAHDRVALESILADSKYRACLWNVNGKNRSALHLAAQFGLTWIVEPLLNLGMDVNITDYNSNTPLILAAIHSHREAANILIEKGAYINHQSANGRTALHESAFHGRIEIVQLLIDWGKEKRCLEVNLQDSLSWTPLDLALQVRHRSVVAELIDHGAEVGDRDIKFLSNQSLS